MYKFIKNNENTMSFHRHIITFFGIKEQAHSLGAPNFELKIFKLQINNGKGENYLTQAQAQSFIDRILLGIRL